MHSLIARFINELLDAELDLNSSTITPDQGDVLTVTAQLKSYRFAFAALFALPALYFLSHVMVKPDSMNLLIALIFCPAMLLMALLIGGVIAEKSIDRKRRLARKSLRLFSFAREVQEPLAAQGIITLTWKWSKSGDQSKGYSKYTITLSPGKGLIFVTLDDYGTAIAFAGRLAGFMGFPLENSVPDTHRS